MTKEDLIQALEKIREGCINVKQEKDIPDETKQLAQLIIKDCNSVLLKVEK